MRNVQDEVSAGMSGKQRARTTRSKWRMGVWLVLICCVLFVAILLVEGFLPSAPFTLKAEIVIGVTVVGCVLLLLSRRSAPAKSERGAGGAKRREN